MATTKARPRLGIALGGGASRGWAHIGVLSELARNGIEPDIVCGTSIGALVGGIYAAGKLPEFESWVASLTRREVLRLLDVTVSGGGVIAGKRLMDLFERHLGEMAIEELPRRFVAVATDLQTGSEVWLQKGSLLQAIRASISLPAVFTPVLGDGRWLVDGGLVNPLPVSVCRALRAEVVVAVVLRAGATLPIPQQPSSRTQTARRAEARHRAEGDEAELPMPPSVRSVIMQSLDIIQASLCSSRLTSDPPDLLLSPDVRHVASMEFAGGRPTIDEGYRVAREAMPALNALLGRELTPCASSPCSP